MSPEWALCSIPFYKGLASQLLFSSQEHTEALPSLKKGTKTTKLSDHVMGVSLNVITPSPEAARGKGVVPRLQMDKLRTLTDGQKLNNTRTRWKPKHYG